MEVELEARVVDVGRPWRVLVVDDDPEVHLLTQTLLELDGRFTVAAGAANGAVAVALARLDPPDAIVLDLAMPAMDGWRALPLLRRACPTAAIVVLSAFPDPLTLARVVGLGADEYLDKASSWRELPGVLGELCDRRSGTAGAGHVRVGGVGDG